MTRTRRVIEALLSGGFVYVVMAACSSTSGGGHGTGGRGHGGAHGSGSGGSEAGIMDALTDPIAEAMAGLENPQSGTRLKAKYIMGADGSKEYRFTTIFLDVHFVNGPNEVHPVWYDSVLQADCIFLWSADGKLRCLPGTPSRETFQQDNAADFGFGVLFTDAQCTAPIVWQESPGPGCAPFTPLKYVQHLYQTQCVSTLLSTGTQFPVHVFQVGAQVPQPAQVYYGTPCKGYVVSNFPSAVAWFSATEVPPSAFVQGTAGVDP
jgi:hypothetical protein